MPGSRTRRVRAATALGLRDGPVFGVIAMVAAAMAQSPAGAVTDATARRVNERIRALQAEADRLASQSRTLLGVLRQLEIQRDIAAETVKTANATLAQAQAALQQATDRLTALDQQRESQLPDLKVRLGDIYKRGRGGYARMLLDVHGMREFARALRAVAALTTINDTRISEHRRTLAQMRHERDAMPPRTPELERAAKSRHRARPAPRRAPAPP